MLYALTAQVFVLCLVTVFQNANAFTASFPFPVRNSVAFASKSASSLNAEKAAMEVTGAELEVMLTEWDQPLLLDAYATWCGPCLLMAPHFEEAAKELEGKVRFVKMDTDKEPDMAARLDIMGLPTLMFLDEVVPEDGAEAGGATAALKNKIEGAITKQAIIDLCNFHFFDGPRPSAPN